MNLVGPFWDQLISTTILASIAGFLLKSYIMSSLKKLEDIPKELTLIKQELSAIAVRIENLDTMKDIVYEHEKVIAVLEALTHVSSINRRNDGPSKKAGN